MLKTDPRTVVSLAALLWAVSTVTLMPANASASGLATGCPAEIADTAAPAVPGQLAGKVTAAIPNENVQRLGQGPEITLSLSDPVNWEDLVRTLEAGRVRIQLLDGSVLNVGARSVLRVTKHSADTQQSEIEMNLGRLRAQVVKFSKPGASFQVKTPTAVIGVVGTDFILDVTPERTAVYVLEGVVMVANILSGLAGQAAVRAGEHSIISHGQPPTEAQPTSQAELQSQTGQTNVGPPSSTGAGTGGGGATAAGGASHVGLIAGGVAAAAGAAGIAVAANQSKQQQPSCDPTPILNRLISDVQNVSIACSATSTPAQCASALNSGVLNDLNQLCSCAGVSFTSTAGAQLVQALQADFQKAGLAFPTACK